MNLVWVPIESLQERYTAQWASEFPKEFIKAGFDVTVIEGEPLSNHVEVGTFLDINSTVAFKSSQMQKIARLFHTKQVKDGTVFFFGDIEFWGIEAVRLMADMNKVKVKLTGFLHAASYTKGDAFEIAAPYQRYTEVGWIAAMDRVFVGSEYHKKAVTERRLHISNVVKLENRILVTGNPTFASQYEDFGTLERCNRILLTNRFDSEKDVEQTLELFLRAHQAHPDWEFAICTGRKEFRSNDPALVAKARAYEKAGVLEIHEGLTKREYHHMLATSKVMVSHSREESFGYCVVEAMRYGCVPYLKNNASHPELVNLDSEPLTQRMLFDPHIGYDEQIRGLEYLMTRGVNEQLLKARAAYYDKYPLFAITDCLKELAHAP